MVRARRSGGFILFLLTVVLPPGGAHAQPAVPAACCGRVEECLRRGQFLFENYRFGDAERCFQRAWDLEPRCLFQRYLGLVQQEQPDPVHQLRAWDSFTAHLACEAAPRQRELSRQDRAVVERALRRSQTWLQIRSSPEPAEVWLGEPATLRGTLGWRSIISSKPRRGGRPDSIKGSAHQLPT